MSPHETLLLGEFAIGTNTLAYVIAEKYDIRDGRFVPDGTGMLNRPFDQNQITN